MAASSSSGASGCCSTASRRAQRRWRASGGWNEALYRTWYLTGAVWTAGWLGLGTAFLLGRTRFGYSFALCLLLAGVFTLLTQRRYDYPGAGSAPILYLIAAIVLAIAVAVETYFQNERWPVLAAGAVVGATVLSAVLMLTVTIAPPGYALDPRTAMPVGDLFPGTLRLLTPFLNITGALALVLGAIFSTYVFMPKKRVLPYSLDPNQPGDEFLFNLLIAPVAILVNFVASLPGAMRALVTGRIHSRVPATILIAIGGFIPAITDSLNRFGSTELFQLGKFLGVLFLFAGFLVSIEVFREIRIPFTGIQLGGTRRERSRRDAVGCGRCARRSPRRPGAPALSAPLGRGSGLRPYHDPVSSPTARPAASVAPVVASTEHPPLIGFGIVIGAAALFGTLGPLARFAYDAGMEPAGFVAWRALIALIATSVYVAWRVRRGSTRLIRLGELPTRSRTLLLLAAVMGFTLNLSMFIAFDRITIALALLGFYTYPAMVAVANVALGRERLDRTRVIALGPRDPRHDRGRRVATRSGRRHPAGRDRHRPGPRRGGQPDRVSWSSAATAIRRSRPSRRWRSCCWSPSWDPWLSRSSAGPCPRSRIR